MAPDAGRAVAISKEVEGYVALSNCNAPSRLIFAGEMEAMKVFQERLKQEG